MSQLAPPPGFLPQLVIDLNQSPTTLSEYLSDPPVYAPNGGTFHDGLIYWGASGGNGSIGGMEQCVGLRTLDPMTNQSTTIINNYFGYYFNTADNLFVHPVTGDVWFTDPRTTPIRDFAKRKARNADIANAILVVQQTNRHTPTTRSRHLPLHPDYRRR